MLLEGPDLEALLDQVRTEHGSNARIVSADRLRKGGVGGFFSKQWFELGVELPDAPEPEPTSPAPDSVEALLSLVDLVDLADARDDRGVSTPTEPAAPAEGAGELSDQPVLPDLADLPRCTATVIPAPAPTFQDILASVDTPTGGAGEEPAAPVTVPAPSRPIAAYAAWSPEALATETAAEATEEPAAAASPAPAPPAPATALVPAKPTELVPAAPAALEPVTPAPAPATPVAAPVDPLAARAKAAARVKAAARAKAAAMGTLPTPAAAPTTRTTARKPAVRKPAVRKPATRPTTATAVALRHEAAPRPRARGVAEELLVGMPGRVFVVAGALPHAVRVAESVAARLRLPASSVLVAGPAETDHARRVYGPEHAATLAGELRSGGPVVVAVDAPVDLPDGGSWAGAIADALGADVLLAVIDGTRRPEDLRRHLDDLGEVSAVALHGSTTADHAAELGLPAITLD
ncbi:hypothetical protein BU204_36060 [Actinophytocola xanthii]|uniref:Uncharacterized protein n=1 Tax=Actinophytocola xanthii TaxID=1912961 RepID=A0A1Q8BXQ9_9PSEU|nr:hypothetical protein BU204_36060 [Actinophytocola xanthii]